MKNRQNIVLVEPHIHGHRETYLLELTQQFISLDYFVIILTFETQSILHSIELLNISKKVSVYEILPIQKTTNFPIAKFQMQYDILNFWWRVRKKIKKVSREKNIKIKLVFFTWLDDYIFDIGKYLSFTYHFFHLFFPFNWSGLYFHPKKVEMKWRKVDAFFKIKNMAALCILDEFEKEKLAKISGKPVIVLPDFSNLETSDADETVKEILKNANGRKIITLTGALQKRKGILTLLDVAQFSLNENWYFIFAGELFEKNFTDYELSRLKYAQKTLNNCYFNFKRIEKEQSINAIMKISDVVYAAYLNFMHSSNILTKSAYFKKPVIVSKGHCMDKRVESFKLGSSINQGNVEESIMAIKNLLLNYTPPAIDEYSTIHNIDNLKSRIKALMALN
jgi:hypothetical protein